MPSEINSFYETKDYGREGGYMARKVYSSPRRPPRGRALETGKINQANPDISGSQWGVEMIDLFVSFLFICM